MEGDLFPSCRLAVLQAAKDAAYLGLPSDTPYFSLADVAGDYILVAVYNEMCTLCLEELPHVNSLLHVVNSDGSLQGKVKLLALGAGSAKRAVARFRREKGYDLPLFADDKWTIFDQLGKPVLPVIYLLKRENGKDLRILYWHAGAMGNLENFSAHLKMYMLQDGETAK